MTRKRAVLACRMAALSILAAAALTACGQKEKTEAANPESQVIKDGDSLVIPVSEITDTASFYPVTVDGTDMEVIAVKAPDGTIRTAFNTCQVCFSSGRGYYKQEGNTLVCQNCGNRFEMSQVEIQSGGCNPWPIFDENKTVTDESITIASDFLKESEQIFANWKTS